MIKKIKQKLILFLIITFVFSNFFIFQIPTTQAATSIPNPSSPPNCNYPEFYDYGEQLLKTQTLTKANSPYCLSRVTTLPESETLTIESGVVIKFDKPYQGQWYMYGAKLFLNGTTYSNGTKNEPVIFTSIYDDTIMGDTNNDNDLSLPAPGNWASIEINNNKEKIFKHTIIKYGGRKEAMIKSNPGVENLSFINSVITKSAEQGITTYNDFKKFEYNQIFNNIGLGIDNRSVDQIIDVRYNWWGSDQGPFIQGVYENPDPNAQKIGGHFYNNLFLYDPWLTESNGTIPYWRMDIQPGDILYDPYTYGVGHTGLYIGNGETIEAQGTFEGISPSGQVNKNNITSWDYSNRKNVFLLRVKNTTEEIITNAIEFANLQAGPPPKPYDWIWAHKNSNINAPSWYCSELVWAAYLNQGIDLEFAPDHGAISPISPAEIFLDDDTFVINGHHEYQGGWKDYVFLLIKSPVEVTVTSPDGKIITKSLIEIPGATYIEDYQNPNTGEIYDLISLPNISGDYQVEVVPNLGTDPESDSYSLVIQASNQSSEIFLAENKLVPAQNENHNYLFNGSSFNFTGFSDDENSNENNCSAGTLDSVLNSENDFDPKITPTVPCFKNIQVENNGTLNLKYKAEINNDSFTGDLDFCNNLNLKVSLNSSELYNNNLENFYLPTTTDLGILNFEVSSTNPEKNKTCNFDFVFTALQENLENESQGFFDQEIISNIVESGDWTNIPDVVLNEFLPNPQGEEYGFDFGTDTSIKPQGEWIELYNNSNNTVDLTGYYLTDASGDRIDIESCRTNTGNIQILSHGYLVVYRSAGGTCNSHNFELNNDQDTIYFYNSLDELQDTTNYTGNDYCDLEPTPGDDNDTTPSGICSGVPPNKSYARIPDGTGEWVDPIPTPGGTNSIQENLNNNFNNTTSTSTTTIEIISEINKLDFKTQTNSTTTVPTTLENFTTNTEPEKAEQKNIDEQTEEPVEKLVQDETFVVEKLEEQEDTIEPEQDGSLPTGQAGTQEGWSQPHDAIEPETLSSEALPCLQAGLEQEEEINIEPDEEKQENTEGNETN